MSGPAILTSLEDSLLDVPVIQYGILAAFVVCIYNYMLTIGDEMELFWANMNSNLTGVLFFLVRSSTLNSYGFALLIPFFR